MAESQTSIPPAINKWKAMETMRKFLIPVLLTVFGCVRLDAQSTGTPSASVPSWTEVALNPSGTGLQISLPVDFTGHWTLGAKIAQGEKDLLMVSDGSFPFQRWLKLHQGSGSPPSGATAAAPHPSRPAVVRHAVAGPALTPHPADEINISGDTVSISAPPAEHSLIVYVQLSHPGTLTISGGALSSPLSLPIAKAVVVSDGNVQSTSLGDYGELILDAAMPTAVISSPALVERNGTYYVRDVALLRSHLETNMGEFGEATTTGPKGFL